MRRIGSWRVVKGESIADAIRKAAELCYTPTLTVRCRMLNGEAVPLMMLPAGVPDEWRDDLAMRRAGGR